MKGKERNPDYLFSNPAEFKTVLVQIQYIIFFTRSTASHTDITRLMLGEALLSILPVGCNQGDLFAWLGKFLLRITEFV